MTIILFAFQLLAAYSFVALSAWIVLDSMAGTRAASWLMVGHRIVGLWSAASIALALAIRF